MHCGLPGGAGRRFFLHIRSLQRRDKVQGVSKNEAEERLERKIGKKEAHRFLEYSYPSGLARGTMSNSRLLNR